MDNSSSPLLNKNQAISIPNIINSDVEGTTKIESITPIKLIRLRIVLSVFLSLLTVFLFPLACRWSKSLTRKFFFANSNISEATHFWVKNSDSTFNICKKQIFDQTITYFLNRKLKYIYYEQFSAFKPLEFHVQKKSNSEIRQTLTYGTQQQNNHIYGLCVIDIPVPSLLSYLAQELTTPFYILQYLSCILWVIEKYPVLTIVMITVSVIIIAINYMLLKGSYKKLREMAHNQQDVQVYYRPLQQQKNIFDLKELEFTQIQSTQLQPGDILVIENKTILPCDCILLSGELLLNEASLTGESIPIPKFSLENDQEEFSFIEEKRSCLFEGTKVMHTKTIQHNKVLALVVRTGFCSFKGQIFRSVLYPRPQPFGFYKQAVKFFIGLGLLVMVIYFVELYKMIELKFLPQIMVLRFWDALFWIVPPALPVFVSMCQTYALVRLRKKGIFGVDPEKSLVAGQINTICFDKTGTLTTNGIEVVGYQQPYEDLKDQINPRDIMFQIFATCHSACIIDGELMGDSLDIEMFKYSRYRMISSNKFQYEQDPILEVLKQFEFESRYQRMSVIVASNDKFFVYSKGAPEKIASMVKKVPSNFKNTLDQLTMRGFRVLALSFKELKAFEQLSRQEAESDMEFLGFFVLENKLKKDTQEVIQLLGNSGLDLKIISGDNGLTTIQCARECNLIDPNKPVLLIDYDEKNEQLSVEQIDSFHDTSSSSQEEKSLHSADTDETYIKSKRKKVMKKLVRYLLTSEHTIKKNRQETPSVNEEYNYKQKHFAYAITGKAFDYFWLQIPNKNTSRNNSFAGFADPLTKVNKLLFQEEEEEYETEVYQLLFGAIIQSAKVFARMRPEQKMQIVEQLQKFERKVAMIGDGANDCAAIQQANVGISFAQADAAFSAPFSSQDDSINCIQKVLLEGRASLTNAIEVFLYYVCVSVLKFVAVMLLMLQGGNFSQIQTLFINYVGSLPFLKAITMTGPSNKLTNQIPQESMFAFSNQVTFYGQVIISGIGLCVNYLYWSHQPWSQHVTRVNDGQFIQEGQLQSTLFLCLHIYFEASLISFYISKPFKNQLYKNYILMILILGLFGLFLMFFLSYQDWYKKGLQIYKLNSGYLKTQLLISCAFGAVMIMIQELIIKKFVPNTKGLMRKRTRKARVEIE